MLLITTPTPSIVKTSLQGKTRARSHSLSLFFNQNFWVKTIYNIVSNNKTLSCLFSRYIVNKSKSEYPETIATYGPQKKREICEFSRDVIRLNNGVCLYRPIRDEFVHKRKVCDKSSIQALASYTLPSRKLAQNPYTSAYL